MEIRSKRLVSRRKYASENWEWEGKKRERREGTDEWRNRYNKMIIRKHKMESTLEIWRTERERREEGEWS